jgi:hypothetical protein
MKSKGLFFNKVVDENQEKYLTTNTKTGIFSPAFTCWQNIKRRCFSNKFHEDFPTYKDCEIHPDWYNFQVFAKWFYENNVKGFQLDKDLLVPGNKVYGPDTCCFLPSIINTQFQYRSKKSEYGLGVSKDCNKYYIDILENIGDKKRVRVTFDELVDAQNAYKDYKESLIRKLTEIFKEQLPHNVYNILINFKVSDYE